MSWCVLIFCKVSLETLILSFSPTYELPRTSLVAQQLKNPPAMEERDANSILRSERSRGKGNGNSLQYFCLGNHMDNGIIVHGVTKESDPTYQLKQWLYKNSNNMNYLDGSPYFSVFPSCLYPSYPVFFYYIPLITLQYTTYLFVGTFIVNQYLPHH